MEPSTLVGLRNLALIWFTLLMIIVMVIPGAAVFFALKGIRWVKKKIRQPLLQGRMWAERIQRGTSTATDKVAAVPIGIASTQVRATTTARGIFDYLMGR